MADLSPLVSLYIYAYVDCAPSEVDLPAIYVDAHLAMFPALVRIATLFGHHQPSSNSSQVRFVSRCAAGSNQIASVGSCSLNRRLRGRH